MSVCLCLSVYPLVLKMENSVKTFALAGNRTQNTSEDPSTAHFIEKSVRMGNFELIMSKKQTEGHNSYLSPSRPVDTDKIKRVPA